MKNICNITFLELWTEYDRFMKIKLKPQSYRKQAHLYKNNIVPYFKDYLINDITVDVYITWMLKMEENGYKFSYLKGLHQAMVGILNHAVKFYNLSENIASKIGCFKRKKSERKNVDFWTLEEFTKFISVVDDDLYKLLFNVLYFSGLRIGECLALTWNDFDKGCIEINKTIAKEKDENGNYIINSPKTESSYRKITLDNQITKKLNSFYKKEKKKEFFDNSWFIFGGIKPLSQTTITRKKDKYCQLANVKKIRLHDFRHSHATFLLSNGITINVISQRLGHSDIAMTLNTYSHLVNKDEEKAIELINSIKQNNSHLFN